MTSLYLNVLLSTCCSELKFWIKIQNILCTKFLSGTKNLINSSLGHIISGNDRLLTAMYMKLFVALCYFVLAPAQIPTRCGKIDMYLHEHY